MFTDLPADTVWQWAALDHEELLQVRYLNWDYWIEGHVRLTALAMAIEHLPPEVEALVGLAPAMDK